MATRAEMEAELKSLREKMAELDAIETEEAEAAERARQEAAREAESPAEDTPDQSEDAGEPTADAPNKSSNGFEMARSELDRLLAAHGLSAAEIEGLADQLWSELDTLPQNKPLVTAIGAFALGFMLGRMTK